MTGEPPSMEDKLADLRLQYAVKIHERVRELQKAIKKLEDVDEDARHKVLVDVRDITHKLAGSGATFGFPEVTTVARQMEHACVDYLDGHGLGVIALEQLLIDASNELNTAAQVKPVGQPSQYVPDIPTRFREPEPTLHNSDRKVALFVMEYDEETMSQVQLEMDHFGFDVRIVDHPSKLIEDFRANGPVDVIVTGLVFDNDETTALRALSIFREDEACRDVPVVAYTLADTMALRLGAVRVGVKAYLVKPVDLADLVVVLDHVTLRHEDEPFHVLIIDDDESLAHHTEAVLQSAGMTTKIILDHQNLFAVLDEFSPELILLDLYMPDVSGEEIATIIRQREEYAGIPIVFLSGEADKDKQLSAMELGGDDFLTKPIQASHLISSVRIRAERFRELRSFMLRDSMTGLFNHTTTKQLLENEIARATRSGGQLALAAIDIDHFKGVNDAYGHAVGDRVIKALSRLLRQRLRSADVIGRMGGEEFAAILSDTGLEEVLSVFDQIRKAFSEIVFHTNDKSFSVTISCGVAVYPQFDSATTLSDAADKALYTAKEAGRNCVVKASG